jgi:hypothetical protein
LGGTVFSHEMTALNGAKSFLAHLFPLFDLFSPFPNLTVARTKEYFLISKIHHCGLFLSFQLPKSAFSHKSIDAFTIGDINRIDGDFDFNA